LFKKKEEEREKYQVKADFLITYVNDKGPSPPALIKVKSDEKLLKKKKEELEWQIIIARVGLIFK
jgi:hypothetical protein